VRLTTLVIKRIIILVITNFITGRIQVMKRVVVGTLATLRVA